MTDLIAEARTAASQLGSGTAGMYPTADLITRLADALTARLDREAESYWLIERGGEWYAAAPHSSWTERQAVDPGLWRENWTRDAQKALRFARKRDAETLIAYVGWQQATATEHVDLQPAPGGEEGIMRHMPSPERLREQIEADPDGLDVEASSPSLGRPQAVEPTEPGGVDCATCQGNGEVVTDWERYLEPRSGDRGDEAVAECTDCDGTGRAPPLLAPEEVAGAQHMIRDDDAVCVACRWKGGHAPDCPRKDEPWPTFAAPAPSSDADFAEVHKHLCGWTVGPVAQ